MTASDRDPREPAPAGVSALLAIVMATIAWFALALLGQGVLSVAAPADGIHVPEAGEFPAILAMAAGFVAFALSMFVALRSGHASFGSVLPVALVTALVHLLAAGVVTLVLRGDAALALFVVAGGVTSGQSLVILAAAVIAAWGGVALRRTHAQRPRWPWEDE